MELIYHRLAVRDVKKITRKYADISEELHDRFWDDLERALEMIRKYPEAQHRDSNLPEKRRRNLKKFPYHILFEQHIGCARIMVVRHNRQKVTYGMRRK